MHAGDYIGRVPLGVTIGTGGSQSFVWPDGRPDGTYTADAGADGAVGLTVTTPDENTVTVTWAGTESRRMIGHPWRLLRDGTWLFGDLYVIEAEPSDEDPTEWTVVDGNIEVRVAMIEPAGTGGGGGAVDSVNGQTGVVELDAADVGADPAGTAAGAISALNLGTAAQADAGDFEPAGTAASAISALDLGTAAQADTGDFDPAGTAAGAIAALALGTAATKNVPATGDASATEVVKGNDSRLSDPRTPAAHNQSASTITSGTLDIARIPTGTTGSTVPFGNDSRFSDARTPTPHASSHARGGSDPVPVAVPGWGTGADGAVTISADTTVVSNAGTGFKHYTNLTVDAGAVLSVVGIVFVSGTLTVNGTISADGAAGSSTVGGTGAGGPGGSTGSLSGNGGAGGTNAGSVGLPTANPTSGLSMYGGGAGGAGGTGASGAGGASGIAYNPASLFTEDGMLSLPAMWMNGLALSRNAVMTLATGAGRGGGGGGGDGTNIGSGGGGGGGFLVIIARHVAGTGTIRANGGAGASRAVGNVAGGGGGGGGFVGLVTGDPSHGFALQVNGGAGGTGNGTGGTGSAGSTGHTRVIVGTS